MGARRVRESDETVSLVQDKLCVSVFAFPVSFAMMGAHFAFVMHAWEIAVGDSTGILGESALLGFFPGVGSTCPHGKAMGIWKKLATNANEELSKTMTSSESMVFAITPPL